MPRRSADKEIVTEAMPQQVLKNIRKEKKHSAPEKGQVATSRTTEPRLARHKRVVQLVITFINNITSSIDRLLLISV